jgi:hypothetical protein
MGYRSDVTALIYGPAEVMDALVMKYRHTHDFDLWSTQGDGFGDHLTEWQEGGTKFILMQGEDWKWYSDYPSVRAWQAFEQLAEELELNGEFVRIGEEVADIEEATFGDSVSYFLHVCRSIECSVGPTGDAQEVAP